LRELNNVIKRAALLSSGNNIILSALPPEIIHFDKFSLNENNISPANGHLSKGQAPTLKAAALEAEQEMIMNVLRQVNFNKSKAAKLLNVDRKTLYNKMKALNIS